ncbi:hypothetical protein HHI36_010374 [Cryptolaemus montrouzieri]|uniref:Uncharacterized protein n=1 Tax=Cryptolaemus montrouzieri TaxID=559131 RepID=A0ABD2MIF1_9CUCU
MKRAIHLAERNKELEKELKDIDQMAIAVEEECNDAVKEKSQKLTKLEMALKDALLEIQTLERAIAGIKKEKQELELNNDILKTEKKRIQGMMEDALKEKIDVNERMNNMKLIEHDLNLEIDRLVQQSAEQKRVIAELESKLIGRQVVTRQGPGGDGLPVIEVAPVAIKSTKSIKDPTFRLPRTTDRASQVPSRADEHSSIKSQQPIVLDDKTSLGGLKASDSAKVSTRGSQYSLPATDGIPLTHSHPKKPPSSCNCGEFENKCCLEKETVTEAFRSGCCETMCMKHFQELLKKEIQQCQCEIRNTLRKVTQERDYYIEECNKLMNEFCQNQTQNLVTGVEYCNQCPKNKEMVNFLQHENKMLAQEKMTLMTRLEKTRNDNEIIGKCNKSSCKRMQMERDLLKADVTRLEEECDCLRDNMKAVCEAKKREHDMFTQQVCDYEHRLRKIEGERGELKSEQGTRRARINTLEEKNELINQMLRSNQDDLQKQKILNTQLRNLQEQTEKSLHDATLELARVKRELASAFHTIDMLKNAPKNDECNCAEIDLDTMKRQLNRLDREKDDLLNIVDSKTEEIASLRKEVRSKSDVIDDLKGENGTLKARMG